MQALFCKALFDKKSKDVRIQLIQSANILIHNLDAVEHKSKIYIAYLLGTRFLLLLVFLDFDFSDDEIVENYMSFLKGLAANLPRDLLLGYVIETRFQVFRQAFLFFESPDPMIKNASRTVILTIVKCKKHVVEDTRILEFVRSAEFIPKLMQGMLKLWQRFSEEVPTERKLLVEYYVSAISDDLCYINDLLEHVEELNHEICNKFVSLGMPWLMSTITTQLNSGILNFIPAGYIIFSILEYIRSPYILNILITSLFAARVSEKMFYFTTRGNIPNNQLDFLENDKAVIINIFKQQIMAFLHEPNMCGIALLIISSAISNESVSKKVLYECKILPKDEIKKQRLIQETLQDDQEYTSDPVLSQSFIQIFTGYYPQFTMFLAARIILKCSFFPEEQYLPQFQFEIYRELGLVIENLRTSIEKELFPEIMLEAFEEASSSVKNYRFDDKLEFPSAMLTRSDLGDQGLYRMPLNSFETYLNYFHKLFLLRRVKSMIFEDQTLKVPRSVRKGSSLPESSSDESHISIDCTENIQLIIKDFEIVIVHPEESNTKSIRLRHIEVMLENKRPHTLNLIINQPKQSYNLKLEFEDLNSCKYAKKIIEDKRKKCKNKEMKHITNFLLQEAEFINLARID